MFLHCAQEEARFWFPKSPPEARTWHFNKLNLHFQSHPLQLLSWGREGQSTKPCFFRLGLGTCHNQNQTGSLHRALRTCRMCSCNSYVGGKLLQAQPARASAQPSWLARQQRVQHPTSETLLWLVWPLLPPHCPSATSQLGEGWKKFPTTAAQRMANSSDESLITPIARQQRATHVEKTRILFFALKVQPKLIHQVDPTFCAVR